ncbi:MAG: hypothetical protein Q7V53_03035 [Caldisericota bacterium]|nr:hypothetical protein [Caldisericota bacterium]
MKRADLTPQGRTNLGACIGRLFAGDDFALKIDGSVRYLCYRAGEELLPRIPKDRQSAGAMDSGLFLSGDSFASIDDLGGEPLERRWLFAGSIDELHIVLDCQGVDVEGALQAMATQASFSSAMRSLQPKRDGPGARFQQVGFLEVDCVLAGNIPIEKQKAQLAVSGDGPTAGLESNSTPPQFDRPRP